MMTIVDAAAVVVAEINKQQIKGQDYLLVSSVWRWILWPACQPFYAGSPRESWRWPSRCTCRSDGLEHQGTCLQGSGHSVARNIHDSRLCYKVN